MWRIGGWCYIGELKFKNLVIRYDDSAISKKIIKKTKAVEIIGLLTVIIALILAFIGLESYFLDIESNVVLSMLILSITEVSILLGGIYLLVSLLERLTPRHYELISYLMRCKPYEIEVGWLNNRYVVEIWSVSNGWIKKEFDEFLHREYKCIDICDKSKPIFMTIDLTKEDVEVTITNN